MKRLLWIPLLILACSPEEESADPPRYTLEAVSGGGQEGVVTETLDEDLVFRLRDQFGGPLSGERVVFALSEGTGSFDPPEAFTGAEGRVACSLTLGTRAGTVVVAPELPDLESLDRVETLSANALPDTPAALAWVRGDGQKDAPGLQLLVPLEVEAQDIHGNAVAGVSVDLSASEGSSAYPEQLVTGSAVVLWTLGDELGLYELSAESAGLAGAVALARADDPPSVSSWTSNADEGDPVTVTGENFCETAEHNTLTLGGLPMVVAEADENSLTAIVPVGLNLGQHLMTLRVGSQEAELPEGVTLQVEVSLSLGSVRDYPFVEGETIVPVSAFSAGSEYVAITYSLRDRVPYAGQNVMLEEAVPEPLFPDRTRDALLDFHARLLSVRGSEPAGPWTPYAGDRESRVFNILSDINGYTNDPASYDQISADLRYQGAHVMIYVDQRDAGGFTQEHTNELGQIFDSLIHPIDCGAFGQESDFDENGRVMVLLSRVVNELTGQLPPGSGAFLVGFFNPVDLPIWSWPAGTSNNGEIFYSIVPEDGEFSGYPVSAERAVEEIKPVLAHEFQHMINWYQRYYVYGQSDPNTPGEDLWLNEGLSHLAENLCGFHDQNIDRVGLYLRQRRHREVALASLSGDPVVEVGNGLGERGASFLFARYLADHWTDSPMDLVKSTLSGRENVAHVTGEDFDRVYKDWLAALYLDGRAYVENPRHQFTSLDVRTDFPYQGEVAEPFSYFEIPLADPAWTSHIVPTGFDLLALEGQAPGGVAELRFSGDAGGEMGVLIIRTGL